MTLTADITNLRQKNVKWGDIFLSSIFDIVLGLFSQAITFFFKKRNAMFVCSYSDNLLMLANLIFMSFLFLFYKVA